jgi:hypothetical protein
VLEMDPPRISLNSAPTANELIIFSFPYWNAAAMAGETIAGAEWRLAAARTSDAAASPIRFYFCRLPRNTPIARLVPP